MRNAARGSCLFQRSAQVLPAWPARIPLWRSSRPGLARPRPARLQDVPVPPAAAGTAGPCMPAGAAQGCCMQLVQLKCACRTCCRMRVQRLSTASQSAAGSRSGGGIISGGAPLSASSARARCCALPSASLLAAATAAAPLPSLFRWFPVGPACAPGHGDAASTPGRPSHPRDDGQEGVAHLRG